MDSACALVTFVQGIAPVSRVPGVSRAQLTLRMKSSDNNPDKQHQRRDEAADAEVLSLILDIIGDMSASPLPSYITGADSIAYCTEVAIEGLSGYKKV